ncbi:FMN-dependent NADH-azoreductase [Natranaerovirga pectinivora]|uniref:FMN dependent NADH:quinone oxidoreductase n=1 Tax=Natranaerovirga pectinivora TaxID=682400 RepID=A0A4R3MLA5_9FIRM|nr:NAD(P)H-dependent oxidoreductase [Natranaerovirga pectinivora]TCT14884.1 FMN-dependent NADH-azoreductase [Natranaerovirga pectinivora]
MKKLLYITCNTKPEILSTSKSIGREFVASFLENNKDVEVNEFDLNDISLPKLHYKYFKERNSLVDTESYNALSLEERANVDRIIELSKEFKDADIYVLAVPMWSLMFPAPLKEYLDCIIQKDILIKIGPEKVEGLLDDKERTMVYIQSSGGSIPWLLERKINHGGTYIKDIFKFLGIKHFNEILVDNIGFTKEEHDKAVEKGKKEAKALGIKL